MEHLRPDEPGRHKPGQQQRGVDEPSCLAFNRQQVSFFFIGHRTFVGVPVEKRHRAILRVFYMASALIDDVPA